MSRAAAARAKAHAATWFERPAEAVARDLLGTLIVSTIDGVETVGRIVETEAYIGPHDEASHAAARTGRTLRNEAMYGPPGTAYVYRIYGIHWCLNVVTDQVGYPAAVLIRAVEPLHGLDHMRARRSPTRTRRGASARQNREVIPDRLLANGPGKLAEAFGIDGSLNAHRLDRKPLMIVRGESIADSDVSRGPRIGITRATDWPLRFWVRGSRWVSR